MRTVLQNNFANETEPKRFPTVCIILEMVFFAKMLLSSSISLLIFVDVILSKDVVLLDTKNATSELKWKTFTNSEGTDDAGWLEETWRTDDSNENRRAYVVCNVDRPNVDNWLRTPFVARRVAARLYMQMTFTMRDCKQFPGRTRSCKETFTLLAHDSDGYLEPAFQPTDWDRVDRITADAGRFSGRSEKAKVNVETRSYSISTKGVYFAFRDGGACISILNVRIFYKLCPATTRRLVTFPATPTGVDEHSIVEIVGKCVQNAEIVGTSHPKYLCKADGQWDLLDGACGCRPGFVPDDTRRMCIACSIGEYRPFSSDDSICLPCPRNTNSMTEGSTECVCDAGYFRSPKETVNDQCSRPPGRPTNAHVTRVSQTSAMLSWDEPAERGGRPELWYRWECTMCGSSVRSEPARPRFSTRSLELDRLRPATHYSVVIYAENDVSSSVQGLPQYVVVDVKTARLAPWVVANLRIIDSSQSSLTLVWDPPDDVESKPTVKFYQIRSTTRLIGDVEDLVTVAKNRHTFDGLEANTDYGFMVRAFTDDGWGAWSGTLWAAPGTDHRLNSIPVAGSSESDYPDGDWSPVWPVFILACVVIVLLVVVLLTFARRDSRKQLSEMDHLSYKHDNMTPDYNQLSFAAVHPGMKMTSPLMPGFASPRPNRDHLGVYKPYVDPLAYEDPNQALMDFTNEINSDLVFIDEVIGAGEFGEVCRGKVARNGGTLQIVAIKTLKPGSTAKAKMDFLTEASIMGQFDHPNVVRMLGVVTRSEPVMIITDYMENHSLDSFLRTNDGRLKNEQLVAILRGIAAGMSYLSGKGFVHRDLAARNVLVDCHLTCKIADFGLSRGLDPGSAEQEYTTKGGKIPVRWTAPEAITHRKFTTSSDVWSFGVVMWEVCSFGERPYWEWTNQKVIAEVQRGFRLPAPMDTPSSLHQLMLRCWKLDRQQRPLFTQLVQILDSYLSHPELLCACTPPPPPPPPAPPAPPPPPAPRATPTSTLVPPTSSLPLEEWLQGIGLQHCFVRLNRAGVRTLDSLSRLNTVDYLSYGLTTDEARRIRQSFYSCKESCRSKSNSNDGFFV